jgi:hypothetical protein
LSASSISASSVEIIAMSGASTTSSIPIAESSESRLYGLTSDARAATAEKRPDTRRLWPEPEPSSTS